MLTGYPSIDKPWLKYYDEDAITAPNTALTIYDFLWTNNKDHLEDIAIDYFDKKITYNQLFREIDQIARSFSAIGVKKDDIVIMATVTTPETIYALYALNRLGAVANMVDPRTNIEQIHDYIIETSSRFILVIDGAYLKIEQAVVGTKVEKVIVVSATDSLYENEGGEKNYPNNVLVWKNFISSKAESGYPSYQNNKCCAIVHTGGTTGTPKGVMLSNENFNEMVISFSYNGLSFDRGRVLLSIMPPFIAYGIVNGIHVVLSRGMKIVLLPSVDASKMDSLVLKYRPSHMLATPTHYDALLASQIIDDDTDLSFIQMMGIGGDGLSEINELRLNEFLQKHNCSCGVIKGYGMTEVSAAACANRPENNAFGSVGLPFYRVIISAFEQGTDRELKAGETGEICIHSPSTMIGYYNHLKETEDIMWKHSDGLYWVHSGDIGYVSEDGNVYIKGRIKRMIIRHDGFKVFPMQIENVVTSHPAIVSSCVVAIDDQDHSQGSLPLVYAVIHPKYDGTKEELIDQLSELCQRELPEYVQPVEYRFIDSLPLTPIGKVDYRSLEQETNKRV